MMIVFRQCVMFFGLVVVDIEVRLGLWCSGEIYSPREVEAVLVLVYYSGYGRHDSLSALCALRSRCGGFAKML
jgi:hypothetical protein